MDITLELLLKISAYSSSRRFYAELPWPQPLCTIHMQMKLARTCTLEYANSDLKHFIFPSPFADFWLHVKTVMQHNLKSVVLYLLTTEKQILH